MNKLCPACGNEYPLTSEYFQRNKVKKGGFEPRCKACTNKRRRAYAKTEKGKETLRLQDLRKKERRAEKYSTIDPHADASKLKRCNDCGRTVSVTEFYINRKNSDGLYSRCRSCVAKQNANRPVELTEKRREIVRRSKKKWQENNPEKYREVTRVSELRRRSRKAGVISDFTKQDWQYALEYFNGCCAVCGRQMNDMFGEFFPAADHFIPLSKGGHTIPENIVPLCNGIGGCNNRKHDKDPVQWLHAAYGARRAKHILERIGTFFLTVRSTQQEKSA